MAGSDSDDVTKKIAEDFKQAAAEYQQLRGIAMEAVMDAPSGFPLSDGRLRIVQASRRLQAAFERYQEAMERYSDFLIHGKVPDSTDHQEP